MVTRIDELKWNLYKKKKRMLMHWGIKNGYIYAYNERLMENLREVYYGGIPGSVLLLCESLCQGFCYDRSVLVTLGFENDDFNIIKAGIDGIKLNPYYIDRNRKYFSKDYDSHSIAERILSDGSRWIYDTSLGLVIEKKLYFLMERPDIRKINNKEATLTYCEYQDIKNADIDRDKYVLPLVLPMIEKIVNNTDRLYSEVIKKEIELLKKRIDYEQLCYEIDEDMKNMGLRKRTK